MPLYVADYLRDTRRLTAAEHGAYLLLIMEYWTTGALPDDDRQLSRITCMTPAEWRRARPNVQPFFTDGWKHKRIDAELARSAEISSKRSASAKQKHSNSQANAEQLDTHAGATSQPQSQLTPSLRSERTRASALGAGWSEADRERFWAEFPNKVGKADAMKAFDKASHKTPPDVLFPALNRYAKKTDDRPFCNPATWLNQERWLDQPATTNGNRSQFTARGHASADFLAGMSSVAADIAGHDPAPRHADPEVPLGRVNIEH